MIGGAVVAAEATGLVAGAMRFAGKHWKAFAAGGVVLALAIALMFTRSTLAGVKQDLAKQRRATAAEEAEHAITRDSVGTLQSAIARQNAAINERSAALEAARKQAAADIAAADQRWQSTADQVERLRALSREVGRPGCEAPAKLLAELEGL